MFENILVIQNDDLAPVGLFGTFLEQLGAKLTVVQADMTDGINNEQEFDGLIVLGGRENAYNEANLLSSQSIMQLIKLFHEQEKPILGICLGAQILARTFEQPYCSNNGWEIGFTELKITLDGKQDPLLKAYNKPISLYEMHEDSFYLPPNSRLLISGEYCQNQAFVVGKFSYGLQFHPEVTEKIVRQWVETIVENDQDGSSEKVKKMLSFTLKDFANQADFTLHLAKAWLSLVKQQSYSN